MKKLMILVARALRAIANFLDAPKQATDAEARARLRELLSKDTLSREEADEMERLVGQFQDDIVFLDEPSKEPS